MPLGTCKELLEPGNSLNLSNPQGSFNSLIDYFTIKINSCYCMTYLWKILKRKTTIKAFDYVTAAGNEGGNTASTAEVPGTQPAWWLGDTVSKGTLNKHPSKASHALLSENVLSLNWAQVSGGNEDCVSTLEGTQPPTWFHPVSPRPCGPPTSPQYSPAPCSCPPASTLLTLASV